MSTGDDPSGVRGGFDPDAVLSRLDHAHPGRLRHVEHVAGRAAQPVDWPEWVAPPVLGAFVAGGVDRLWSHQREVADAAWAGEHVVVSTGTASGKSLGYLVPALTAVVDGTLAPNGRGGTVLYLAPTKALAADQSDRVLRLAVPGVRVATYDGDTPADERRWIRDHAAFVLSNPDLLHHSLLPGHERWASFLRALQFVVVDECHAYRGVFGAHVAAVLRRLRRVAARYRSSPTFVLASATVGDPARHAHALIGMPVRAVTEDGSPRHGVTIGLWEPGPVGGAHPELAADGVVPQRRSATTESADLLADLVVDGVQTVAFARSRAGVEALASGSRRRIELESPSAAGRVAAYRGGYLPEERRVLEREVRSGQLLGLAATNALELGVDIRGLDAVLMAGWPGRRASFWQQAGRAGRDGGAALALFVAADDPLDTYLVHHPEAVFGKPVEVPVIDPDNPRVLAPQLAAAAAELPLRDDDLELFGPAARAAVASLVTGGVLRRRPTGWYWARQDRATDHVDLRGVGTVVSIVEESSGRVVGTIDEAAAHAQVHTGAVHVHQGVTYVVTDLDLESSTATVVRGDPGWSTMAQSTSSFELGTADWHVAHGPVTVAYGPVRVTGQVTGFVRRLPSGEVIGRHGLELPARTLATKGVWWTMDEGLLESAGIAASDVPGALHAAEHAAIAMLPIVATCDRWDVGGVSTACHPDTGLPTILVYDGYPGGAGFARRASEALGDWLGATLDAVAACGCEAGCPGCVQSPKCGNGNEPLDKAGAIAVLGAVLRHLGMTAVPIEPR